jgi:hypothetical protein
MMMDQKRMVLMRLRNTSDGNNVFDSTEVSDVENPCQQPFEPRPAYVIITALDKARQMLPPDMIQARHDNSSLSVTDFENGCEMAMIITRTMTGRPVRPERSWYTE